MLQLHRCNSEYLFPYYRHKINLEPYGRGITVFLMPTFFGKNYGQWHHRCITMMHVAVVTYFHTSVIICYFASFWSFSRVLLLSHGSKDKKKATKCRSCCIRAREPKKKAIKPGTTTILITAPRFDWLGLHQYSFHSVWSCKYCRCICCLTD